MSNKTGFMIDAPNVLITTPKGDLNILTASSGEVSFSGETIPISGGWSNVDLIEIDTKSNIEISLTDAEWKMQSLALTSGGTVTKGVTEQHYFGNPYAVATDKITIPFEVIEGSVKVNGFTEATDVVKTKEFKVVVSEESTEVTFFTGDFTEGEEVMPSFKVEVADGETLTVKSDDIPSSGQIVLQYPIYGDKEGTRVESIGQVTIYKAKIMRDGALGGSYKSATTFDMNLKGLDPRRADREVFKVEYIPVPAT